MPNLKIKELVIIALPNGDNQPVGDAPRKGQDFPKMTADERVEMEERLLKGVQKIINLAQESHLADCQLPDSKEVDPHYITRASTNEFFFYTREPLTLPEFEKLMDEIANQTAQLPAGIHFALGSFAVIDNESRVMNISPYIKSGDINTDENDPSIHLGLKNNTSDIDVFYPDMSPGRAFHYLPSFDQNLYLYGATPEIKINMNGKVHQFKLTLDTLIPCVTPGGEEFKTVLEVCVDHYLGVAKNEVLQFAHENPSSLNQAVVHLILSNIVDIQIEHCLGFATQVDPEYSHQRYSMQIPQKNHPPFFGENSVCVYESMQTAFLTLKEAQRLQRALRGAFDVVRKLKVGPGDETAAAFLDKQNEIFSKAMNVTEIKQRLTELLPVIENLQMAEDNRNTQFQKALSALEKFRFGHDDKVIDKYIKQQQDKFNAKSSTNEVESHLNTLKTTLSFLQNNTDLAEIRASINKLRDNVGRYTIGINRKANKIEVAITNRAIIERCHFRLDAENSEDVREALSLFSYSGSANKKMAAPAVNQKSFFKPTPSVQKNEEKQQVEIERDPLVKQKGPK